MCNRIFIMSKVKINKKLQKSSVLKIVGLVFMVITLLAALALTNNTVRQFITDSFADGGRVASGDCEAKGSPSARNACRQAKKNDAAAAAAKQSDLNYWYKLVKEGKISLWEYIEARRSVLSR